MSTMPASVTDRYIDALEGELRRWLAQRIPVGRHYDLLAYHMGWMDESLREGSGPRGKRFRPLLCLLSCDAVGGDWRMTLPIAAAIEFLHNFSLIHDDIEDHDESRHHRAALWKLQGEPLAINAGDAMLALAGLAALSTGAGRDVARRFQETALALTEGQYLDMSFESQAGVTTQQYFHMIGLKTGALIGYACEAGGQLGDGSSTQVQALATFGRHFGLAFQIFDDIRGIWSSAQQTGKAEAKDIVNRKKSLPVLMALERAHGSSHELLARYYTRSDDADPADICDVIESLGVRQEVRQALSEQLATAFAALERVGLNTCYAGELRRLASTLVEAAPLEG